MEETILHTDVTETEGTRKSYLKCLPGRHVMLRVVTPVLDPELVITSYFDRQSHRSCGGRNYLNLTDRPIKDSEEVADGIVVDCDTEGHIVGVEILDASKRTNDPATLKQFGFELPTVG